MTKQKSDKPVVVQVSTIQLIDVAKLAPNPTNRNHHPQNQIDRLAKLYRYQGFRNPIIVSNQSGYIVAGHGRRLAAIQAGLLQVPVSYQDFESPEQEYAFGVSDNAVGLEAELDLSGINADLVELDPSFDLDHLGILDFKLDVSEFENPKDGQPDGTSIEPKVVVCPNCLVEFNP